MITVLFKRSKSGVICSCSAEGHAGYSKKGYDIVCSAVTVLLKTTVQVLSNTFGIELKTDRLKPGSLSFEVFLKESNPILEAKLEYAGDFLETGLESVRKEFPQCLKIVYTTVQ